MLAPGTNFDSYRIDSLLGQGGMGEVYKAYDTINHRPTALKVLSGTLAESVKFRDELAAEAKITAAIDSPYVVKIFEYGEFDGRPFVSMEYVEGSDLRTAAPGLSFEMKMEMVGKLMAGIKAAHDLGLAHRDLKPENILLDKNLEPKILDFGLARQVDTDEVDEFGNVEGTLYYLSPEQVAGEPATTSSDLFSLGTILYELFVGCRPFEGAYSASIIYSILHENPEPPIEVDRSIPPWLNSLIMKLLVKSAEDRFAGIDAVIEFLDSCKTDGGDGDVGIWDRPRQTVTMIELKNLSGDKQWGYFCEGFTDDMISELSRRTDLIVTAEPATSYSRDVRETFNKLRTDFVIMGSLMLFREKMKLNLNIYGDKGDKQIWSQSYSDSADNLFKILTAAATDASINLARVTDSKPVKVDEEFRADVSAYDYYLKGKNYYQTNKPNDLSFAIDMYKKAIEIDATLALAHAGLSDVYTFQYMAYYVRTPERIGLAKDEALKAIKHDPKLPEGHRALARYHMFTGNEEKSEECLQKAVGLSPKYAVGYRTLAWLKEGQGDHEAATTWAKKALQFAPVDLETLLLLSLISINRRKYTLAMATLERAIELGPDYGRAYYYLGQAYLKLGAMEPALKNFELAIKYEGDPNCYIDCGYVLMINKKFDGAKARFEQSAAAGCFPFVAEYFIGFNELLRGNSQTALVHFIEAAKLTGGYEIEKIENIPILAYNALAQAAMGNIDEMRDALEKIEKEEHLNGEILYTLARCLALAGEKDRARKMLDKAIAAPSGPSEKEAAVDPHFWIRN